MEAQEKAKIEIQKEKTKQEIEKTKQLEIKRQSVASFSRTNYGSDGQKLHTDTLTAGPGEGIAVCQI